MADFVQVMRDWRRMCKAMTKPDDVCCADCALQAEGCCSVYEDEFDDMDLDHNEETVCVWAERNPEPKYPTWGEHFRRLISLASGKEFITDDDIMSFIDNTQISDNIAEMLGIKPKGDTHHENPRF